MGKLKQIISLVFIPLEIFLFLISSTAFSLANAIQFFETGDYTWEVYQLTKNNTWDVFPIIKEGKIVWKGKYKNRNDSEILLWNGKEVTNISRNKLSNEYEPSFDGNNICWRIYSCNDNGICKGKIYFYNGKKKRPIASYNLGPYTPHSGYPPSWHSLAPTTHNGYVSWAAYDGNDYEIYIWKNNKIKQVTNNDTDDFEPQVCNGQIAWTGYVGEKMQIFFWDGIEIKRISNNDDVNNTDPNLYDSKIVWAAYSKGIDGKKGSHDIFYWDGTSNYQVTHSEGNDYEPAVYENEIAWHWWDGNDYEILYYDGNEITQITDNEVDDLEVSIYQGMLVWHRYKEGGTTEIIYAKRINK